ncbi:MAG TPA: hypothetical protein VGF44_11340 [Terriglobales bacterium]|jgi:hypothetical protein
MVSKNVKVALLAIEILFCELVFSAQREGLYCAVKVKQESSLVEYLNWAKYHPDNQQFNQDYHVAYLTAKYAESGSANPWNQAILKYYGTTASKWIQAKRDEWERWERELESCGRIVAQRDIQLSLNFNQQILPPKKPSQSVRSCRKQKGVA